MHPFERYLQTHRIEPLALSIVAKVRYLTVWNAMKGKPIRRSYAIHILHATTLLTGVLYTGKLALLPEAPVEQTPTIPLARITLLK